jgi:hypothetical protein
VFVKVRLVPSVELFDDVILCKALDMGIILKAARFFLAIISVVTDSKGCKVVTASLSKVMCSLGKINHFYLANIMLFLLLLPVLFNDSAYSK